MKPACRDSELKKIILEPMVQNYNFKNASCLKNRSFDLAANL